MDTKNIEELLIDPNNPKTVSDFQGNNLAASLNKYGSLDGIIFNRKLGKLAGGNTRIQLLATKLIGNNRVTYTSKYDFPDEQGTVALGYVWHNNMPIPYRETEWDEVMHREASIAAGMIHGDFVDQLLAEANQFIMENNGDVFATGQTEDDINKLLEQTGPSLELEPDQKREKQDDGMQRPKFKFTEEQYDVVYQAIGIMKRERQLTNEPNPDLDSNALYYICRAYAENSTSQNIEQASDTPDPTPSAAETPQPDLTSIPA
jgi:hypothetical protein